MIFEVLTLFPEMFSGPLDSSIVKRARDAGRIDVRVRNIRDYATDKHRMADDQPYGGGPGMVMKPEPIAAALDAVAADHPDAKLVRIYLSPEGERWSQKLAEEFAGGQGVVLLCGHYEGVDERIRELYIDREISIGDYVLTGGELPAMVIVDSIARLIPGVVGNSESIERESFAKEGLLDHPHYTRPEEFQGLKVPEILLSGHHKRIEEWRRLQALERTLRRRPDIVERCRDSLTKQERRLIESLLEIEERENPE